MKSRVVRRMRRITLVVVMAGVLPLLSGGCYGSGVTTGVYVQGGYGGWGGYGPYGGYRGPYRYPAPYPGPYPIYGGGVVITGRP